jgi:hypothetical protein
MIEDQPQVRFAHLKRLASERADRTVERARAGITTLRANGHKITAEALKQVTRELEPGFAGLTFQVIRRNPRAYALYREAADAFIAQPTPGKRGPRRRRRSQTSGQTPRSSYDALQRLDKKELAKQIRTLEAELQAERQRRAIIAYDKQALLATMLRLETDLILRSEGRS